MMNGGVFNININNNKFISMAIGSGAHGK